MVLEVAVSTLHVGGSDVMLSVDLSQQRHSAALWVTKQPFLGTALLAPQVDRPKKGGLKKLVWPPPGWLAVINGHLFKVVRKTPKDTRKQQSSK